MIVLYVLVGILTIASQWVWFQKMGRQGWESIIPFYNTYVLFKELYGDGWKMLFLLIPLYNIYVAIKMDIDLAHAFNQSTGFGIGLLFLPFIFGCILAFGGAVYGDGSRATVGNDVISRNLDKMNDSLNNGGSTKAAKNDDEALDKIRKLVELHDAGVLTDEEFEEKKKELLARV